MTIDFHDKRNKKSYTERGASDNWKKTMLQLFPNSLPQKAADIGCGGGIYTRALSELGVSTVTGVDYSKAMLEAAISSSNEYDYIHYHHGDAFHTKLQDDSFDLVLSRALIHHLTDLSASFQEAYRILREHGTIIIQDRTPQDCLIPGSTSHIRGYFFTTFPHLLPIETKRRYESNTVIAALKEVGFTSIKEQKLWETRRTYETKNDLFQDLRNRKGRSILHEISDKELTILVKKLDEILPSGQIVEKDRWTIWSAEKPKLNM